MVKRPAILAALFATCAIMAAYAVQPLCIDGLTYLEVNDSRQCLLIRSSDPDNPVLLYLHGGPGQSLIPFAHVATSFLTDRFTVVYYMRRPIHPNP